MKYLVCLLTVMYSLSEANASAKGAYELYQKDKSKDRDKKIAHELIEGSYYFSAIPYINDYLEKNNDIDSELEADIETLVLKTGTMAVLNLDEKRLESFNIKTKTVTK